MFDIPYVQPGQSILASSWNLLVDAANSIGGTSSPDLMFTDTKNGKTLVSTNKERINNVKHTALECEFGYDPRRESEQEEGEEDTTSGVRIWLGDDPAKNARYNDVAISSILAYEDHNFTKISKDSLLSSDGWWMFKNSWNWDGVGAKICTTTLSTDPYILVLGLPKDMPKIKDRTISSYTHCNEVLTSAIWLASKAKELSSHTLNTVWSGALVLNDGGAPLSGNWDWPRSESGNYLSAGDPNAIMYGHYMYGYQLTSWHGRVPRQPNVNYQYLMLTGNYSSTGTGLPLNVSLTWLTSYAGHTSLSSFAIPLYMRDGRYIKNDGPTYDFKAGLFTIPTYY